MDSNHRKKPEPTPTAARKLRRQAEQRLRTKRPPGEPGHAEAEPHGLDHELQVHQIELELQNEGLQLAQARMQEILDNQAGEIRRLALELSHTEQRERRQLAQVLHDQIQQLLVSAKYHLEILRKELPAAQRQQTSQAMAKVLQEAIHSCRSLTYELGPPILPDAGLTIAIEDLGRLLYQNHGLVVQVQATEELRLADPRICFILYQAVRELLFNVIKHAGVKAATVSLGLTPDNQVRIRVEDHGHGFDLIHFQGNQGLSSGFGLFSLRERLEFLEGRVEIQSAPGQGSQFTLWVPLNPPAKSGSDSATGRQRNDDLKNQKRNRESTVRPAGGTKRRGGVNAP